MKPNITHLIVEDAYLSPELEFIGKLSNLQSLSVCNLHVGSLNYLSSWYSTSLRSLELRGKLHFQLPIKHKWLQFFSEIGLERLVVLNAILDEVNSDFKINFTTLKTLSLSGSSGPFSCKARIAFLVFFEFFFHIFYTDFFQRWKI